MAPLPPPHHHTLNAASGWLGLGMTVEAQLELDRLPPELRTHRLALDVQFAIHAENSAWDAAYTVAESSVSLHPEDVGGWIQRAFAARRKTGGGLDDAFALLLPAAEKFPKEVTIPYNLACYCAQKDRLAEAWQWYRQARSLGNPKDLRKMALADEDLKPLWSQIAQLA
jgi:hypothetical protein